jgi:hypothetical protein
MPQILTDFLDAHPEYLAGVRHFSVTTFVTLRM